MSDQAAYPLVVAKLAEKIPATIAVGAEARSYFEGSIEEATALRDGVMVESPSVLDEVLRVGEICVAPVLAKKVPGYGPLRLRYFLDLAVALAGKVAVLDASRVEAAGAGAARVSSLRDTRGLRRSALRVLKNLAGRRPEERTRIAVAARGEETPDERARSLETLGKEVLTAIENVPKEVAEDAGATKELVDALAQTAGAVLAMRGEARGARGAMASIYDEMNVLDGRLLHELRLLVGAMRDARREDASIPAVKSALIRSGKKKSKKVEGEPQPR